MRFRLALLGTATSLALAAAVATAAPAEARRSIGGFDVEVCVPPGNAVPHVLDDPRPGMGPTCICITDASGTTVVAGPNDKCPPGNDPTRRK
jgi:hypothetical protein